MKKVIVNAQITAFVSISEVIGFAVIFVITIITKSKTTGKFLFRFLESILLPYIFTKNTDENKEQVIEHGWMNFLGNTFKLYNFTPPCWQANDVIILNQIENDSEDDIFIVSERISHNKLNDHNAKIEEHDSSRCNINVPLSDIPSSSNNDNINLGIGTSHM